MTNRSGSTTSARGRLAASGSTFVWIVGLHLLPLLHQIDHRPDHSHGPLEPVLVHTHGPDGHPHAHPAPPAREEAPEPLDSDHGRGSLLHSAVAVVQGETPALPEPAEAVEPRRDPRPRRAEWRPLLSILARGPPTR